MLVTPGEERKMRRPITLIATVLVMLCGDPRVTHGANGVRQTSTGRSAASSTGSSVDVVAADGSKLAKIAIDGVTDPFGDYSANSAPQRGFHYVTMTATFVNTGARHFALMRTTSN